MSEKGRVTIPKPLRERLGIRPGQVLEMDVERGRLVTTKAQTEDRHESVVGLLRHLGRSTDELIDELRGRPDSV